MATSKTFVEFVSNAKKLIKDVGNVDKQMGKLGTTVEKNSRKFMRAGAVLVGVIGGLTAQGIAYGTTIDRMSKMTGQSAEDMSRLAYSAELLHGDASKLEKGLRTLARAAKEAGEGAAEYADEFALAGIETSDWAENGIPPLNDLLLQLADYMSSGANEGEKLGLAMSVLGGRQSELVPWLKQGSAAIRAQFEEADRLGITMSGTMAEGLEKAGTQIKQVKLVMRGLGAVVATIVAPVIEDITGKIIQVVAVTQIWTTGTKKSAVQLTGLAAAGLLAIGALGKMAPILGAAAGPLTVVVVGVTMLAAAATVAVNHIRDYNQVILEGAVADRAAAWEKKNLWAIVLASLRSITDATSFTLHYAEAMADMATHESDLSDETSELSEKIAEMAAKLQEDLAAALSGANTGLTEFDTKIASISAGMGAFRDMASFTGDALDRSAAGVTVFTSSIEGAMPILEDGLTGFQRFSASMLVNFTETLPQAMNAWLGGMDQAMGKMVAIKGKWAKMTLNATKNFLVEFLGMIVKAKITELMMEKVTQDGKIIMSAFLNPGNLGFLAGMGAVFAASSAALKGLASTSFAHGGVVTESGQFTGMFDAGDMIVGPDRIKALLSGKGGGGTKIEAHIHVHGDLAMSKGELDDSLSGFADRLALQAG